jgi:hypothetical protein
MKSIHRLTRTALVLAGVTLLLTGALSQPALAFNFQQTDLILAIYGNRTSGEGTEALVNLSDLTPMGQPGPVGDVDALTNPSQTYTFDLSAYLNAAGVIDNNPADPQYPVRYTVMGVKEDPMTSGFALKAGSFANLAGTVQASNGAFLTAMNSWSGNVNDTNAPNLISGQNGSVLSFTNANSMTSRMGLAEKLNNGFNVTMGANVDQLLHIIKVDSELVDDPAMAMGQAMLSANGIFQITGGQLAAIPLPGAVVLFGTGMIGLAAMARRNLFGQTA